MDPIIERHYKIKAEISRRINQDVLVLFKERYDKGGMPIPHKK